MARGDAAEILQPAEAAFDHGAVRGGLSAMPDARLAVGAINAGSGAAG
jgi:hypothetical protein